MENPTNDDTRGQVGIGTLIIFIAMVLVAAVAAGVLINTAGLLESSASDTASDSQAQVSNQVSVVSASGEVTGSSVDTLHFVVKKSPGSDDIDLEDLTIDYQSDSTQKTLEQAGSSGSNAFTVTEEKGDGSTPLVIDSTAERYRVTINLNDVDSPLDEGGEATVKFVDQSGAATIYGVNVPDTISGGSYVSV